MKDHHRIETRYKTGKHQNWLKTLEIKMPSAEKQSEVGSEFPLMTESGSVWLHFPNRIGIKKVVLYFDYGQDFYWVKK